MASEDVGMLSNANDEELHERSVSAEPLVSSITLQSTRISDEEEMKSSPIRQKGTEEMPSNVAKRLRNVLNTRPSIRMASRHQLAPLHQDSFSRDNPIRHTLGDVRRLHKQKTALLSNVNPLNLDQGLPLQKMDDTTPTPASNKTTTGFPLAASTSFPNQSAISSLAKTETKRTDVGAIPKANNSKRGDRQDDDVSEEVPSIVVVQDIEQQKSLTSNTVPMESITAEEVPVRTLERTSELQKSTRHLKQRMLQQ